MAPWALLVTAFVSPALLAAEEGLQHTKSVGSPREYPITEDERVTVFNRLHGTWPPSHTYPGKLPREESESAGWRHLMAAFEEEARGMEAGQLKWNRWLEVAQMRMVRNYSATGWLHDRLDADIHAQMASAWEEALRQGQEEREQDIGFYVAGSRDFWDVHRAPTELISRLMKDVAAKIAAWVGIENPDLLQSTAVYGVRSYRNGSVLKPHVDVVATHVLSAIYCVEVKQEEGSPPWHIGTATDFSGEAAWVDLRPGELFLYESAKLPHGRPSTFVGDRYAAMFLHFKPPDWELENYDRVYVVPPGWNDKQPARASPAEL